MQRLNPHPYQFEAIKFLLQNSHAGLFFDPGLGKTACVLAALLVLKQKGMFKRALVVAPRRVANNVWPAEKNKWLDFAGLSLQVLHGSKKNEMLAKPLADICVVTPEGLSWLQEREAFPIIDADVLVIDESSYFRNGTTQRFKALRPRLSMFKRRIILTGTPAPRSYEDLWSQIFILDRGGALGPYISHYRNAYFVDVGYGYPDWKLRDGSDKIINEKIRPLVLRGDSVDHLEMPKLIYNTVVVGLPPAARDVYDEFEREFYIRIDGQDIEAPTAAVAFNKLRQASNGFLYTADGMVSLLHEEKLDALEGLVAELQGQSALILYEYQFDKAQILRRFPQAKVIGGGTSERDAATAIAEFNAGTLQLLLAHPASAGHGINLQDKANHIIWYAPTVNLEHFVQATARVWRQGNPHERVFVHTIAVRDSVEERVAAMLASKGRTQESLLNSLKSPIVVT